jgi:hypothetical protein
MIALCHCKRAKKEVEDKIVRESERASCDANSMRRGGSRAATVLMKTLTFL